MKLTPIFPPHIKPVRVGVYKTTVYDPEERPDLFSYWNGKWWGFACYTQKEAIDVRSMKSGYQNKSWQGVAR